MKLLRLAKQVSIPVVIALALSFLSPTAAEAKLVLQEGTDPAAILFDPLIVNDISLNMSSTDFESLKYPNVDWNREGDWRKTTMRITVAGKKYGPYTVGVHLKGAWGSWRDVTGKAAFKIKMNAFVKGQTLFGLTKLTLNNMVQDRSYIHEFMTYQLMRSSGLPAPRTGYSNVSLNGINYGLHLNVETVDRRMLARWGITSEKIYKGSLPNFPDFYPGNEYAYTIESGTETDRSDLANFLNINQLDGEAWWQEISQATDMELVTRQWAAELYAGHWDGYLLNRNNYYINFDENGKVLLMSWGVDQTWGGSPNYFGFGTLLPTKCMGSQSCKTVYYQAIAKVADTAQRLNLGYLAQSVVNAIAPAILADPMGPGEAAFGDQAAAINQESWRKGELNQFVIPWDATIKAVKVNKLLFQVADVVYLPSSNSKATISAVTRQSDAITDVLEMRLIPGENKIVLTVISPNGEVSVDHEINFYLLTRHSEKLTTTFPKSSSFPAKTSSYAPLIQKLTKAKIIELTITRPTYLSNTLFEKRLAAFKSALKVKGVTAYRLNLKTAKLPINQLLIEAKYQN